MKIAILSDIHGNIDALKAVVKQMEINKIEHVFYLGDQMGYYPDVVEVYNEIDKLPHNIIAGNHERIFIKYLNEKETFRQKINKKYGSCFSYYTKTFSSELILKIKNLNEDLQVKLDGFNFLLCHGSPIEKDHYLYPDVDRNVLMECIEKAKNNDVVFMGHTHYPMLYSYNNKQLINVGSVGQSRVVGGIANWGVFNTENGIFVQQNTLYNTKNLKTKIKHESKMYLSTILDRNNNL